MTISTVKPRRRRAFFRRSGAVDQARENRSQADASRGMIPRLGITSLLGGIVQSISRTPRVWLFSALTVILVWLVISSFVAYRTDRTLPINPELENSASPVESNASDSSESEELESDPTIPSAKQISAQAEQVLVRNPLNAQALRILGQVAAAAGDEQRANAFFQAAARRSLREDYALSWLVQKNYEHENFATAIHYADALLRTRPQLVSAVTPLLARMLENNSAGPQLQKLLAENPPWRPAFLAALPPYIGDARITLNLLLNLRETATPPTMDDLRNYLNFLIRNKLYEFAYYAWLQFLPPEQLTKVGFLINGSFERTPSGLPFDWVIKGGPGVTIDIVRKPDARRQHALYIEFGYGRVGFHASQLLRLAPGTYQLEGQYIGELKGRRGLVWRITCADNGKRIGQSDMVIGEAQTWTDFSFSFTVPDRECGAQTLQLVLNARSASERLVSGAVWYDDLRISRSQPESN